MFFSSLLARHFGASCVSSLPPAIAFLFSNTLPVYLANGWFIFLAFGFLPLGLWT